MNKKRIIGEGSAVETHGRASWATMGRKTHGRASLLVALIFLFGACEKEIPEGVGGGKKVEIFFSTDITGYHAAGDMVRSGGAREPISTIVPLNKDFHLRATLVPDEEGELRVPVGFENGQKICFEAYNVASSATPVDSKIYSWSTSAGKFIPDTDPLGVDPDGATVYRFVAYSYFGETGVAPAVSSIDPVHDLVWGKTATDQTITDTEVSRTVSISMTHRFARVKVRVRSTKISTATITALSGVEVAGGKLATLNPFDGDVTFGSAATQGVDITVPDPAEDDIESLYRTVTPVGSGTVSVKLGTVKVSTASSTTFSNKWAAFSGTLDEATSYTLVVDLKRGTGFAYSNIYWDGEKLTFDTVDKGHQGYQGVFFKWGSLVGVSPAQVSASNEYTTKAVPIYVPVVNDPLSSSTWTPTTSSARGWTSWGGNTENATDIPYLGPSYTAAGSVAFGRDNQYVIDVDRNTLAMYQGFRGDICQYLTKTGVVSGDYRLPTSNELGPASGWTNGGRTNLDNTLGNAEGTVDLLTTTNNGAWAKNADMRDVIFPASGYRVNGDGGLSSVGSYGPYWSGSTNSASVGYIMSFTSSTANPYSGYGRGYGCPVRCVQN